jgi:pimeloyl-ACP methyl ester carboxylesterase
MRASPALIGLAAAVLAAGCGGEGSSSATRSVGTAGGSRSATAAPKLAEQCGDVYADSPSRSLWFRASDRVRLHGVVLGRGRAGVVLAHQYPADLCGWASYAGTLARNGFQVLLFDFRGFGESERPSGRRAGRVELDVAAAAAELRRLGARSVILVGASFGGAAVLVAAPMLRPSPAGVVSLSGEADLRPILGSSYPLNALAAVPRLRSPLLLLVARGDSYISVPGTRSLLRAAGTKQKRLVVFPAGYHGVELLTAPYGPRVHRLLLAFLRAHSADAGSR